jgi:hypothetical protein
VLPYRPLRVDKIEDCLAIAVHRWRGAVFGGFRHTRQLDRISGDLETPDHGILDRDDHVAGRDLWVPDHVGNRVDRAARNAGSIIVQKGPASTRERSRTVTPLSGGAFASCMETVSG